MKDISLEQQSMLFTLTGNRNESCYCSWKYAVKSITDYGKSVNSFSNVISVFPVTDT